MTDSTKPVTTLSYWNVLILPTGEEIFVGLRQRPESMVPEVSHDGDDQLLPFALHNSDPIESIDTSNGFGLTRSGQTYMLIGDPSDPHGMIRFSVSQMMRNDDIQWKYDFADIDPQQ